MNKELDPAVLKTVLPCFKKRDLFRDVLTARVNIKRTLARLHRIKQSFTISLASAMKKFI